MPCFCHYEPENESKRLVKEHLTIVANELRRLYKEGDPVGLDLEDVIRLLRHLVTGQCDEQPGGKK